MDLALNNLPWLIFNKKTNNQPTIEKKYIRIYFLIVYYTINTDIISYHSFLTFFVLKKSKKNRTFFLRIVSYHVSEDSVSSDVNLQKKKKKKIKD